MDVSTFLEVESRRPFEWGQTDCATTADRWFRSVHGFSPMFRYGRMVMNEQLGRAWLEQPGGLYRGIHNVMRCAEAVSLEGEPVAGDIGVVVVGDRACIAIFDAKQWRSRDEDGFIFADDCHRVAAWEVTPCRRH